MGYGYDGPRKRTYGTLWGEAGTAMFPQRSACQERGIEQSIHFLHPSVIEFPSQVSGDICWLKGLGLLPGHSCSGFQHFSAII